MKHKGIAGMSAVADAPPGRSIVGQLMRVGSRLLEWLFLIFGGLLVTQLLSTGMLDVRTWPKFVAVLAVIAVIIALLIARHDVACYRALVSKTRRASEHSPLPNSLMCIIDLALCVLLFGLLAWGVTFLVGPFVHVLFSVPRWAWFPINLAVLLLALVARQLAVNGSLQRRR